WAPLIGRSRGAPERDQPCQRFCETVMTGDVRGVGDYAQPVTVVVAATNGCGRPHDCDDGEGSHRKSHPSAAVALVRATRRSRSSGTSTWPVARRVMAWSAAA